jgi:hypothetical protein
MKHVRSVGKYLVKYLAAFGAGVVAAGFFFSSPADPPAQHPPTTAVNGGWVLLPPTTPFTSTDGTFAQPMPERTQPSLPSVAGPPNIETTGSSAAQSTDIPKLGQIEMTPRRDAACNVSICRRFYRSFDEATCTYRPYGGGPPQLCNR